MKEKEQYFQRYKIVENMFMNITSKGYKKEKNVKKSAANKVEK